MKAVLLSLASPLVSFTQSSSMSDSASASSYLRRTTLRGSRCEDHDARIEMRTCARQQAAARGAASCSKRCCVWNPSFIGGARTCGLRPERREGLSHSPIDALHHAHVLVETEGGSEGVASAPDPFDAAALCGLPKDLKCPPDAPVAAKLRAARHLRSRGGEEDEEER